MSDAIKNVAIFGSTGMTGSATLPIAVAAGTQLHNDSWDIYVILKKCAL